MAGYPMGGDSLSITKGIVSRVVMTRYAHASNKLLGIQIDAAINPGNSGGPAFSDLQEVLEGPAARLAGMQHACPGLLRCARIMASSLRADATSDARG